MVGERNSSIFINEEIPSTITASLIIKFSMDYVVEEKEKNQRLLIIPELNLDILWGFFDGSSQGHPVVCGVGVVLFLK
jgi:hypothetical protein